MQVIDTVVLVAFRDRNDPAFKKASEYVVEISLRQDILVPSATLMEFDLELKSHGIDDESRADIHSTVARLVPRSRILPLTSDALRRAAELTKVATWRGSYFDTLIAATGLEFGADSVVTTDRKFAKLGIKPIF
jgi:predicted nucleic-acid-binding protein